MAIIDAVLERNGYKLKHDDSDETQRDWGTPPFNQMVSETSPDRWWGTQSYKHKNPSVWYRGQTVSDVRNEAGKGSVKMSVTFADYRNHSKQLGSEVRRVCDELVEELAKRYGKENVKFSEQRLSMKLN